MDKELLVEELEAADRTICELCKRVNPQHAMENNGNGCVSCEDRERRMRLISSQAEYLHGLVLATGYRKCPKEPWPVLTDEEIDAIPTKAWYDIAKAQRDADMKRCHAQKEERSQEVGKRG